MANILYRKQKQQVSYDNGATWNDTGEYRIGDILENPSNCQTEDSKQCRWVELDASEGYYCDGYKKYTVQVEECTENGIIWTRTGEQKKGNTLIDSDSVDCGYIPQDRWVVSGDPIVCECGSVIYYEYEELYDDGVWKPTGNKRESEDFAITSGWTCYEETYDDYNENDDYYYKEIGGYNPQYTLLDYLYYDGKFITLEREYVYDEPRKDITYLQIDDNYYTLVINEVERFDEPYDFETFNEILYEYNGYLYIVKVTYDKTDAESYRSLYKIDLEGNNLELVLNSYNAYYGYDIIYSGRNEKNELVFKVKNLETNEITTSDFGISYITSFRYKRMEFDCMLLFGGHDETIEYNPCNKTFKYESSYSSIGYQLGNGIIASGTSGYSGKTDIRRASFYIVNGNEGEIINEINTNSNIALYHPYTPPSDCPLWWDKFYHKKYKESKHYDTASFVYKGNTIFNDVTKFYSGVTDVVNGYVYNISKNKKLGDSPRGIRLTDNENIFLGESDNYSIGVYEIIKYEDRPIIISFAWSGTSTTQTFRMNGTTYTATTNPYSATLSDLGIDSFTNAFEMFYDSDVTEIITIDTSNVTNMGWMFSNCYGLTSLDASNWNTSKVTNMEGMFNDCRSLTSLNASNWDVSNVIDADFMFRNCSGLTSLDLSGWDVSNAICESRIFSGCTSVRELDLSSWNTSNVTSMYGMFEKCSGLTSLDLSGWDTSNVTNMEDMFRECSGLTSLDVNGWDTSKVTNMNSMFEKCSGLTSLDVSNFNTSAVTSMGNMFSGCTSVRELDLSSWNTSNVTSMYGMFENCSGLTSLDLSGWDTSNVTNVSYMFYDCTSLTSLDVSGWDTSKITDNYYKYYMFKNCTSLTELKVKSGTEDWWLDRLTNARIQDNVTIITV